MVFNSLEYILFFIIVLAISSLSTRRRWVWLLIASYYFYSCWRVDYLPLLIGTTLLNYCCAIAIARSDRDGLRRALLVVALVGSLGLLFVFKYFNFASDLINKVYMSFGVPRIVPTLHVLLPVGISFYTFQALAYTIDVFNKKIESEKHIGIFALFISFFPQLVAGPIERASNLLSQLKRKGVFGYERMASGLLLATWGLFKKIVIADRLAIYVDAVYGDLSHYPGPAVMVAAYFFTFQIYCDFSGYSDIAIGCARMMGYDLCVNFDAPYFSVSIPEFWRRWHISLMSWFRDYLYFPIGGSRKGEWRKHWNQFVVFVVSGLWHGANLTFLLWGFYHACLQILTNVTRPMRQRLFDSLGIGPRMIRAGGILITFHLVCLGWIFFRAQNISHAGQILRGLFRDVTSIAPILKPLGSSGFAIAVASIAVLLVVDLLQKHEGLKSSVEKTPYLLLRYPVYAMLLFGILLFGIFKEEPFLYFQF